MNSAIQHLAAFAFFPIAAIACGAPAVSTAEADRLTEEQGTSSAAFTVPTPIAIPLDQTGAICVGNPGNSAAQIKVCGANGVCHVAKYSCFPYHCDGTAGTCATSCGTNANCAAGYSCKSGTCVMPFASCKDANTSMSSNGAIDSCGAYQCNQVTGLCKSQSCSTTGDDCSTGALCDNATSGATFRCLFR